MNNQQPKTNIQHPLREWHRERIGCWMFGVQCWMLLLLPFSAFTTSAQTTTNALPALAPPYGEMPPTFWQQHRLAIILAGLALLVIAVLILKAWLRPPTPVIISPGAEARQALARLQNQPEDGSLLSAVSQILRHCAAKTFALPDGELTTADFVSALAHNDKMDVELGEKISAFLRECDVRKFSPAMGQTPLDAAARALELVALIEKAMHRQDTCATTK